MLVVQLCSRWLYVWLFVGFVVGVCCLRCWAVVGEYVDVCSLVCCSVVLGGSVVFFVIVTLLVVKACVGCVFVF